MTSHGLLIINAIVMWLMTLAIWVLILGYCSRGRQIRALNDERIQLVQELDKIKASKGGAS